MNKKLLLAFAFAASAAHASVTIQIDTAGWGDETSSNVNGLAWGIVVDSNGSGTGGSFTGGFIDSLAAALDGFALPGTAPVNSGVLIFDEYYFVQAQDLTTNSGPAAGFTDGYMNLLGSNLDANVSAGDDYGLLWFSVGTGTLGSSDFFGFQDLGVLPSDGSSINPGTTPGQTLNAIGVPEPSTYAALSGLLALSWVMLRRRRA